MYDQKLKSIRFCSAYEMNNVLKLIKLVQFWNTTARNGERIGDVMRASIRGRSDRHARRIYAKIMGHPSRNSLNNGKPIHIRNADAITNRTNRRNSTRGWKNGVMDDPSTVCVRFELSDSEVFASSE